MKQTTHRACYALLCALLLSICPLSAADCKAVEDRPAVGLVLSGGGARGAAHVGVIKVLEQLRIPVDCIAGTSMGAIVGGLYSSGLSAQELEETLVTLDWEDALQDEPSRQDLTFRRKQDHNSFLINFDLGFRNGKFRLPKGLVQGQKLNLILRKLTASVQNTASFDALPIPFRAVATDVENGDMVVIGRGDLVSAMKASMSAPGVFAPVEREGRLLIDGGVANNLPVDVVRAMGADILIVVDIGFPLRPREELDSAITIADQMLTILIKRKSDQQLNSLTPRDIAILPELGDIGSADFHRANDAVPLGEAAALQKSVSLQALVLDDTRFLEYQAAKQQKRYVDNPTIRHVVINDNSNWSERTLLGKLSVKSGDELDLTQIQNDISGLYGLDTYELVDYKITPVAEGEVDVEIGTKTKSWGPNFINMGVNLYDDFKGSSGFNLTTRFTKTQVNPLGAEWRIDLRVGANPFLGTEFYQPLNYASDYFIAPRVAVEKSSVNLFDDQGNKLAEYRLSFAKARMDIGRTFGPHSELRLGLTRAAGRGSLRIGDPASENFDFQNGAFVVQYNRDSRDNVRFPRSGSVGSFRWDMFREALGDEANGDRLFFDWLTARSFGEHTFLFSTVAGTNLDSNGQIEDLFEVGGLFNVSGIRDAQLRGQHSFVGGTAYYRRINFGSATFRTPLYLGVSAEAGNVWNDTDDISASDLIFGGSVFVGLDTFIGPLYLAHGIAEDGLSATYFFLGQPFGRQFVD